MADYFQELAPPPRHPRVAIILPARFASTRFPGKPLAPLLGATGVVKPLIQRSWEAACAVRRASEIRVATDDLRIQEAAEAFGAATILTSAACRNGTERCWDAVLAAVIDADIVINLQGDSPLTPAPAIEALIDAMTADPRIQVATPMVRCSPPTLQRLRAEERAGQVGGTTVVFDRDMDALYFSKRVIPHVPAHLAEPPIYLHLGLYAYRRDALACYCAIEQSPIEEIEGLEQLRFLHAGIPIRMVEVAAPPGGLWEVNNPSDVPAVEQALAERLLV